MNTSARPEDTSCSRAMGVSSTDSVANFKRSRMMGSCKVPLMTATTVPGLSMSSQDLMRRL